MRLACDEGTVGKAQTRSPAIINALASGKKNWVFRRRIARSTTIAQLTLGTFPAFTIAAARDWARTQSAGPQLSSDPAARDAMSRRTAYVDAWQRAEVTLAAITQMDQRVRPTLPIER